MKISIQEILDFLEKKEISVNYVGNEDLYIEGFCSLNNRVDKSIFWIKDIENYDISDLQNASSSLIVSKNIQLDGIGSFNFLFCENPKKVFFTILQEFFTEKEVVGIKETAIVKTEKIGKNCSIGYGSYIGENVIIGDNVIIGNNVIVENRVHIGADSIIHSGAVIGKDGFGYFKNSQGVSIKVPHFGGVKIGKQVEIGANTCIDRGTLDDTIIGDYVKIDNLCHIAHNVEIGEKTKITAMSLLAGSSKLGKECYVAPKTVVKNQVKIGEQCVLGMGAMVLKNVDDRKVLIGSPAKVIREATEEDMNL